jgi:hypothetical protein
MKMIRIVSDGVDGGIKCYDTDGKEISLSRCVGIDIKVRANGRPEATFSMIGSAFDITAIKKEEYQDGESPIHTVHFWNGKTIDKMTMEDCNNAFLWMGKNPRMYSADFHMLVLERMKELEKARTE